VDADAKAKAAAIADVARDAAALTAVWVRCCQLARTEQAQTSHCAEWVKRGQRPGPSSLAAMWSISPLGPFRVPEPPRHTTWFSKAISNRWPCLRTGYWGMDCAISWGPNGKPQLLEGRYKPRKDGVKVYVYELPANLTSWWVWRTGCGSPAVC
jgi:hypothetical protein